MAVKRPSSARLCRLAIVLSFPAIFLAARFAPLDRLPATCGFYRFTGRPCPTCGMTRSFMASARLDAVRAVAFNPLGPVLFGLTALWWLDALWRVRTGRPTRLSLWARRNYTTLTAIGLFALAACGAARAWPLWRL